MQTHTQTHTQTQTHWLDYFNTQCSHLPWYIAVYVSYIFSVTV